MYPPNAAEFRATAPDGQRNFITRKKEKNVKLVLVCGVVGTLDTAPVCYWPGYLVSFYQIKIG